MTELAVAMETDLKDAEPRKSPRQDVGKKAEVLLDGTIQTVELENVSVTGVGLKGVKDAKAARPFASVATERNGLPISSG